MSASIAEGTRQSVDQVAYVEVLRFEHPQPHAECFACVAPPPMKEPGFCTNCGTWFDRARMTLHCTERQEPPPWDEIRRANLYHLWSSIEAWNKTVDRFSAIWPASAPAWVYRIWDAEGACLYIGKTRRYLEERLWEHRHGKDWWERVERIDAAPRGSDQDALDEEKRQIRAVRPLHNIVHNRDSATRREN